jgi:homogentisate 1,2-dioxygenase
MQRAKNQRTWFYRTKPTVGHSKHTELEKEFVNWISDFEGCNDSLTVTPDQLRWKAYPFPKEGDKVDFLHGISTYCGAGSPGLKVRLYNNLEWSSYSYV